MIFVDEQNLGWRALLLLNTYVSIDPMRKEAKKVLLLSSACLITYTVDFLALMRYISQ